MYTIFPQKKSRVLWVSLFVIPFLFLAVHTDALAAQAITAPQALKPPDNHARSAALMDVTSGRLLFSQRGDERMKIASLTKIMTAIVAIEHGDLDSTVKVSAKAAGKEGSSLYLKAGEKISLHNVLYGLMLRSGNDAAVAIAEHVGGSLEGFAYLMNKKAEEIGLTNSQFMNPHGLDQEGHYSSANDLAKLTAYSMHNPDFKTMVSTKVKSAPNPHDSWDYKWVNKNKMLTMYEGADGVKTGYTRQALRTLVSSATRNGQQLVAVTLNDGDDWRDHRNLLDYGFAQFPLTDVVKPGDPIAGYAYEVTSGFKYPFAAGERERLEVRLAPLRQGTAPYRLGYRGQLRFVLNEQIIGSVPFVDQIQLQGSLPDDSKPSIAEPSAKLSFAESMRLSLRALFLQGGSL
ncbi:D-alanyl-D-alanine carboxypeptidase family protein [Cohnella sp.]|uniref:D-alanyl-D-alanine carboxypeptidase family protein n=1 Tax=Cohnella sp. TaxID=1883426 RepID=UPI003561F3B1